jgi:hypothetical protein
MEVLKCYHPYFFQTGLFFADNGGSVNDSGLFCLYRFDDSDAALYGGSSDIPISGIAHSNTSDHDNIADKYKIRHHKNGSR